MDRITIFLISCILAGFPGLFAQPPASKKDALMREIRKVSEHYKSKPDLSFDMNYYYSAEATPGVYLDSLKGSLRVQGNNYWYSIDSTESISTSGYTILLFKEDKIMYLMRPDSVSQFGNPVTIMDSILLNNKDITGEVRDFAGKIILSIQLPPGGSSKSVEYHINKKTGFLEMIRSVVKAEQLYDPSIRDQLEKTESYVCVDAFYKNYRTSAIDKTLFDINRYFKREGEEYLPAVSYEAYKIFLGTTNL